nr:MAG: hypothetical protein 3 [Leviviridae sp.]
MQTLKPAQANEVFRGLVEDVEDLLSLPKGSLEGDFQTIARTVEARGVRVYLLDLPRLCSELESSLERGYYLAEDSELLFHSKGQPTIFREVYARIFHLAPSKSNLTSAASLRTALDDGIDEEVYVERQALAIRCLRTLLKVYKKYQTPCPKARVQEKIHGFEQIEHELPAPSLSWGEPTLVGDRTVRSLCDFGSYGRLTRVSGGNDPTSELGSLDLALECAQRTADSIIGSFRFDWSGFRPKHGPGAVSDRFRNSKYEFPSWPERLERRFPFDLWGMVNHSLWSDPVYREGERWGDPPCKLIDVPKDYRGPRLIASEPICNQFVQQGLLKVLRRAVTKSVLRHSIDFRSQEPSRLMALEASRKGSHATVDLSDASDRMSCALVERVWRKGWGFLECFNAARTPSILLPSGTVLRLKKFAAQGSAVTFPVQTITYALLAYGAVQAESLIAGRNPSLSEIARQVRVFGDDIIVPEYAYNTLVQLLEASYLKVNTSKSFNTGLFREACGMDAFAGHAVTASSVRSMFDAQEPTTLVSVVECSNQLYMSGFINASRRLLDTIPEVWTYKRRKFRRSQIPWKGSGSTAFGVVGCGNNRAMRRRYNGFLHRSEVRCVVVADNVLKTTVDGPHRLMQWFTESPKPDSEWSPGEVDAVVSYYRHQWVAEELLG